MTMAGVSLPVLVGSQGREKDRTGERTFEFLFVDGLVVLVVFILLEGFLQVRSMLLGTPGARRGGRRLSTQRKTGKDGGPLQQEAQKEDRAQKMNQEETTEERTRNLHVESLESMLP